MNNNEYELSDRDIKIINFLTESGQWRILNKILFLLNNPIRLTHSSYENGKETLSFVIKDSSIEGVSKGTANQFASELINLISEYEKKIKDEVNISIEFQYDVTCDIDGYIIQLPNMPSEDDAYNLIIQHCSEHNIDPQFALDHTIWHQFKDLKNKQKLSQSFLNSKREEIHHYISEHDAQISNRGTSTQDISF